MKTYTRVIHTTSGKVLTIVTWKEPVCTVKPSAMFDDGTIIRRSHKGGNDVDFKCIALPNDIVEYCLGVHEYKTY